MDVRAPNACFFQDFERPDRSFGPSANIRPPKLPLRADFSFFVLAFEFEDTSREAAKDPEIKRSRSQQRSGKDHPPPL